MLHWKHLVQRSDEELAQLDIGEVNLACAVDLPDAQGIDVPRCIRKLDEWAAYAREFTARMLPAFRRKPGEYNGSEGYFRVLCMITALQRDLGLRYNAAKIPVDVPLHTADTFIHGALLGDGGTCASLPVVHVAVGRRLGYPLKLVAAKAGKEGHLFARWDEQGERFNIEATSQGLNCYPDGHYRTGVYAVKPDVERRACLLKSMRPREELASFLCERACGCRARGDRRGAANGFAWAASVAPHNSSYLHTFRVVMNEWDANQAEREPPGFPPTYFTWPPRRFPEAFPLQHEKELLCLEATENILKEPELDARLWEPMRRLAYRGRQPKAAVIVCRADGACEFSIKFGDAPRYSYKGE